MKLSMPQSQHAGLLSGSVLIGIVVTLVAACGGGAGGGDSDEAVVRHALAPAPDNRSITFVDSGIPATLCYQLGSDIPVSCTSAAAVALHDWQDGMVGRDVTNPDGGDGILGSSYGEVSKSGGGTYARTECVKDKVTGLVWEGKPSSGSRAATDTYNNIVGVGSAAAYVSTVNAAGLCGYTDWRLPTRFEVQTLVHYGRGGVLGVPAAIDEDWFPNTQGAGSYLSSSPYVGKANQIWRVGFGTGDVSKHPDSGNSTAYVSFVRLVRGAVQIPSQFTYSADGTEVTDANTKLIWSRCSMGQSWSGKKCIDTPSLISHEQAFAYARSVKGWRLPNVKELSSLVDVRVENPSIDTTAFPSTPMTCFWSSSPFMGIIPDDGNYRFVWTVDFNYGSVDGGYERQGRTTLCGARLVRSAP